MDLFFLNQPIRTSVWRDPSSVGQTNLKTLWFAGDRDARTRLVPSGWSLTIYGCERFVDDPRVTASQSGAGGVEEEEMYPVLSRRLEEISSLGARDNPAGPLGFTEFHHDPDKDGVFFSTLHPFKLPERDTRRFSIP